MLSFATNIRIIHLSSKTFPFNLSAISFSLSLNGNTVVLVFFSANSPTREDPRPPSSSSPSLSPSLVHVRPHLAVSLVVLVGKEEQKRRLQYLCVIKVLAQIMPEGIRRHPLVAVSRALWEGSPCPCLHHLLACPDVCPTFFAWYYWKMLVFFLYLWQINIENSSLFQRYETSIQT